MIEYLLLGIAKFMSASDRNAGSIVSRHYWGRLPERFYSLIRASEWLPYLVNPRPAFCQGWLRPDPVMERRIALSEERTFQAAWQRRHRAHVAAPPKWAVSRRGTSYRRGGFDRDKRTRAYWGPERRECRLWLHRRQELKDSTARFVRLHPQSSPMRFDDRAADR
jgi:hypothetical protein